MEIEFFCFLHQTGIILKTSQFRMDRFMTAFLSSDGPRRTGIPFLGSGGIIEPLSVAESNRVNRRKIDDVKAHSRDLRKDTFTIFESTMLAFIGRSRSGKQFVPSTE